MDLRLGNEHADHHSVPQRCAPRYPIGMATTAECELPSFADLLRPHGDAIESQARDLCELLAGWDNAEAPAIDRQSIANAVRLAAFVTCPECLPAKLLPSISGNVIVDWTWGDERVEAEIDAAGDIEVLVKRDGGYHECSMSISRPDDLAQLAHLVTGIGLSRFNTTAA